MIIVYILWLQHFHFIRTIILWIQREALEKWEHAVPKGVARRKNKTWIKHIRKYIDYGGELTKREHIKIYKRWIKWEMEMNGLCNATSRDEQRNINDSFFHDDFLLNIFLLDLY